MSKIKDKGAGCLTDISTSFFVFSDSITDLALRHFNIVLLGAILLDKVEEIIVDVRELVFSAGDVGNVHVMGGRAEFFQLLAGEDVDGNKVDFGVTVLTGLRGAHFNNLAGATLYDDVPMAKFRVLHMRMYGASVQEKEGFGCGSHTHSCEAQSTAWGR